jgi:hypothetical protein
VSTTNEPRSAVRRGRRACRRRTDERGAALVEFALISVPLFLILFGTIEFGWAFFQLNDIRHGAREGIRLVVVNADVDPDYGDAEHGSPMTPTEKFAQATCERMDQRDGVVVRIVYAESDPSADADNAPEVGDDVELQTSKSLDQLTMVFDSILSSVTLDETITSRLEQNPPSGVVAGTVYPDADGWECQ